MTQHTVQAFERELRSLETLITQLADGACAQLAAAMAAIEHGDTEAAEAVIRGDSSLDDIQKLLEAACIRILALRAPHADDLRQVVTTIKAANELERIGDYAKNIAKREPVVVAVAAQAYFADVQRLARLAEGLVRDAARAFVNRDAELARITWSADQELDVVYTGIFAAVIQDMMHHPDRVTPCTHLLFVAKNLERIGDHATNIAELVPYLADGSGMPGERPKADSTTPA